MSQLPITTPPSVMDEVLARHFAAEANHDMATVLDTLTDDVEHDVVGWRDGPSVGLEALRPFYELLFSAFQATDVRPLRRYYGDDFCVDEVEYHALAVGRPLGLEGRDRPVRFRLLHICEFRSGKISRENVWLDAAALFEQLGN
jgi:ketosteroid isomerase-like protein